MKGIQIDAVYIKEDPEGFGLECWFLGSETNLRYYQSYIYLQNDPPPDFVAPWVKWIVNQFDFFPIHIIEIRENIEDFEWYLKTDDDAIIRIYPRDFPGGRVGEGMDVYATYSGDKVYYQKVLEWFEKATSRLNVG